MRFSQWLWPEFYATLRLAIPVSLSSLGSLVMITTDIVMVGQYTTRALAQYGLALAAGQLMTVVCFGMFGGGRILAAHSVGAGHQDECGAILRTNMQYALWLGGIMVAICLAGEWFFLAIGQGESLATGGAETLLGLAWGLPSFALFIAMASVLEGIGRPKPAMLITVLAVLLNVLLNQLLIFPFGTVAGMGATGAALATSIARTFMMMGLLVWIFFIFAERHIYGFQWKQLLSKHLLQIPLEKYASIKKRLRHYSWPMCVGFTMEAAAFSAINFQMGWVGETELAAYQVVQNVYVLTYMFTIGSGAAISVRVGYAFGQNHFENLQRAFIAGICLLALYILPLTVLIVALAMPISSFYSQHPLLIGLAAQTLQISAIFLIFDAVQGVLVGALRGMGDFWNSSWIVIGGFWLGGVCGTYVLSILWGMGLAGLVWSMSFATLLNSVFLAWRFFAVQQRMKQRVAHV